MAKKHSDDTDKQDRDSINPSDQLHHVSESARQAAIAKMKQAQVESDKAESLSQDSKFEDDDRKVTETEIDPKAQKALKDLFGHNKTKREGVDDTIKQVKVYSPFRIYYDSPASSVSAINGTGPFDILPGHKNFLSLLAPGDIVVRSVSGKEERITIERGVMHVHSDIVHVFLDV